MKISEIITDKYKLRMPPTVYYDLLADVVEVEEDQEPCEDAISRQAVIDLVVANHIELNGVNVVMYSPLCKDIKQLSPVNPQPKTGHWYDKWGKDGCSVCNEGIDDAQTFDGRPFKYCPMCGARMVEPQESEDKE